MLTEDLSFVIHLLDTTVNKFDEFEYYCVNSLYKMLKSHKFPEGGRTSFVDSLISYLFVIEVS